MLKIGTVMLVHTGLMILCGMISYALADSIEAKGAGARLLSEFVTAFGYAAPFLCAAALLMFLIPKESREPMRLRPAGGIDTVLVVIAGIGITYGAAYLNSLFVSFIDFSGVYEDTAIHDPTDIVSAFLQTALVPAFCEEFLFRGCICSQLLPYGKKTAVIGSALLFALMHGNFQQFFYTFAAGIVLGLAYTGSGSIWPGTFMHMFNNMMSIPDEWFRAFLGPEQASLAGSFLEAAVLISGLAAAAVLIIRRNGRVLSDGGAVPHAVKEMPHYVNVPRLYFAPTVIVFAAVSVAEGGLAVIMSLL